ncbi:MBL fold metallo-hydrolase [Falsibacillus albus]|uniref:MBL fold metallo-hydrolase n=1 Tax=Falsibacillus albus TaxID=2478915 RepID=A0A3L7JXD9_9BACI|nr:MBL fold metallo-hydrolase [Falsibacillus albus]RLQ95457.1 MBL fold metallo-hydrolase [Falsibacillus albus]
MKTHQFEDLQMAEIKVAFGRQALTVYMYMIDGMLVDTGPYSRHKELKELLKNWNFNKVVLTHHHEDHTGLAHWIQENKDVPLFIHSSGIELCQKKAKLPLYRRVFWGSRAPFEPIELPNRFHSDHYEWRAVHTPGHACDHVTLFNQEKGWMFGGDLYVLGKPKSMFAFESAPMVMDSLRKVLSYDFDAYICSHAGILRNGKQDIKKKLNYLEEMEGKILELNKKGFPPKAISNELFPKKHALNYLSLFENSPHHLVNSFLNAK